MESELMLNELTTGAANALPTTRRRTKRRRLSSTRSTISSPGSTPIPAPLGSATVRRQHTGGDHSAIGVAPGTSLTARPPTQPGVEARPVERLAQVRAPRPGDAAVRLPPG